MKFIDLKIEYDQMKNEIDSAIKNVIENTDFIMGKDVSIFEQAFLQFIGVKYAYGVSSGTDALQFALMALDIKQDDEVITTPFTFIATAEVITLLKAKPVFVDIDPNTYNIDVNKGQEKITKKTKAIIPVHLYGQSADMDELLKLGEKYKIKVIEDAAQATGSKYKDKYVGSIGDIGCFSFFPSKNIGCFGDAGAVTTNNDDLAKKLNAIRQHGSYVKYEHEMLGCNGRLDTIQAAVLKVKLKYFDKCLALREKVANLYLSKLKNIDNIILPIAKKNRTHTYNQFTIRTKHRDELKKYLQEKDIPTAIHYPKPLHLQKTFSYLGYKKGDLPESESASQEVLSLPMFPYMKEDQIEIITNAIKKFFQKK